MDHELNRYLDELDEQVVAAADDLEYQMWVESGAIPFERMLGGLIDIEIEEQEIDHE